MKVIMISIHNNHDDDYNSNDSGDDKNNDNVRNKMVNMNEINDNHYYNDSNMVISVRMITNGDSNNNGKMNINDDGVVKAVMIIYFNRRVNLNENNRVKCFISSYVFYFADFIHASKSNIVEKSVGIPYRNVTGYILCKVIIG